jgi:hypothetical protein
MFIASKISRSVLGGFGLKIVAHGRYYLPELSLVREGGDDLILWRLSEQLVLPESELATGETWVRVETLRLLSGLHAFKRVAWKRCGRLLLG